MTLRLQLDENGRILIPEEIRESLHLRPLDEVEVEVEEGQMSLRRVGSSVATGQRVDFDVVDAIERDREERMQYLIRGES